MDAASLTWTLWLACAGIVLAAGVTQGTLGFGGKFYDTGRRWYVSCYPEDATAVRRATIASVNAALEAF